MTIRKQSSLFILLLSCAGQLQAVAPVNFMRPYDTNLTPSRYSDQRLQMSHLLLIGATPHTQGWDGNGNEVDDTRIWNADQNALAMVKGYADGTELASVAQESNAVDGDDGIRGHFKVKGDFKVHFSYLFSLRFHINKNWWIGAFLPFYKVELKEVAWEEQTKDLTADDTAVKTNITNDFFANVSRWGNGLSLQGWGKTGQGDLTIMGGWSNSFVQHKPWIKRVDPVIRVGVTVPTGVKKNEDKIMFTPFGNDGAAGVLVGAGLNINFVRRIDAGIDIELMHVFNNTRERRIKVNTDQTELLLLTKTAVQKDPGFTQKFTLYCEPKLGLGFSARLAYQHVRRGEDTLYVISNGFSSTIANTAESLKEWTTHNFVAQLKWNTANQTHQKNRPEFTVFFAHPFNGRRSVQTQQFGFGMVMSF